MDYDWQNNRNYLVDSAWDLSKIQNALQEAATTLKHLPKAMKPSRLTLWPDLVRSASALYDQTPEGWNNRKIPPSPDKISRMDRVLPWLFLLDDEQRKIVWARASGISWRRLEDIDGRSHMTLRRIHAEGIERIWQNLSEEL